MNEDQLHLYPVVSRGTRVVPDRPHLDVYAIYHETDEDGRRRFFKATMDQAYDWVKDREDLDHIITVYQADKMYNRDEFLKRVKNLRAQMMYDVVFEEACGRNVKSFRGGQLRAMIEAAGETAETVMLVRRGKRDFTPSEFMDYVNG